MNVVYDCAWQKSKHLMCMLQGPDTFVTSSGMHAGPHITLVSQFAVQKHMLAKLVCGNHDGMQCSIKSTLIPVCCTALHSSAASDGKAEMLAAGLC